MVVLLTAQFITLFNQTALEVRAAAVQIHQRQEFFFLSSRAFCTWHHATLRPFIGRRRRLTWKEEENNQALADACEQSAADVHVIISSVINEEVLSPLIKRRWLT